jgi:hypothetical protein
VEASVVTDGWEIVLMDGEVWEVCYPSKNPMLMQEFLLRANNK